MENPMHPKYSHIIKSVQVNIPFTMLVDDYLERFLEYRLNPEISLEYLENNWPFTANRVCR
jgi:hypothetical protein